jgi:signal transduction histidine kinase
MLAQSAALAERSRIDRELHDALGHNLVVLSLNLQAAAAACEGGGCAPAAEMVRGCHALARLILSDLRGVVREGREIAPVDLRAAVERLAAAAGRSPAVRASVGPGVEGLDAARAHALFRCAQEFITNTLKHAGATEATIDIARSAGGIELRAADNGRGAAAVEPGAGLGGVRERIAELGGSVRMETAPGRGFRMTVTLPDPGGAA